MAFFKRSKIPRNNTFYERPKYERQNNDAAETDTTDQNYDSFGKIFMFGEFGPNSKPLKPLQNYDQLLKQHLRNKTRFQDANFPAERIALTDLPEKVVWRRPREICENAKFIVDGATRFDIDQGLLGDCWFLAAIANLTTNPKIFEMVVPKNQSFSENYAGIFHFRFWQYGQWVDIVIDDKLPTINNQLVYLKAGEGNEFWPPLLEKAFAKFYGSYKSIEGGRINEALEDLCGGLSEVYDTRNPELYEIIQMSYNKGSFMGCSIPSQNDGNGKRSDGLVVNHAYSITGLYTSQLKNVTIHLIRVRNPWGSVEWNGPWSDNSVCWSLVPKETKQKLWVKREDGEFWMNFTDFTEKFIFIEICHLNPTFQTNTFQTNNWKVYMFEDSWGPKMAKNQYLITVRGPKETHVVIGLMQKFRRELGQDELPLGLLLYQVQKPSKLVELKRVDPISERQLTARFPLFPGTYCIEPIVVGSSAESSYLLRVYLESGDVIRIN
ncbi:calpain-A [Tribolium castaneum]|uniref:Calpain-A-like Protein n=1 Tax=Tribolium castaneum TaxID=7070 RepID=D2A484_TRICA|nr:PREDICTED: calpain-A [Tribolium castaneum]EFA04829.1 Calpain-A-like Protein [Tribolium castaneum]|eukprot:XP_970670.2 PREDICTED: calpain-A [Tribolium castaneum]